MLFHVSCHVPYPQIEDLLPHRDPMLLIDELTDIKKLKSATAIVNVKKDRFYVQGHIPGQPVMPGVLLRLLYTADAADEEGSVEL